MTLTREQLGGLVRRPRLEARLDQLVDPTTGPTLMLVSAPPGFGKSTLVAAWAQHRVGTAPVSLVDLREARSGPRALWRVLLAALIRAVEPALAEELRKLAVPDRLGHENFLVDLLDTLSDRPVVLVLDDAQAVRRPTVLAQLDGFLARVPPSLAVVLLSRTLPPLPALHDLRLRGQLDQLRAPDLAFTPDEVAACCRELAPDQRQLVWERTEGWPAMVRLMELGVQDGLSESDFWNEEGALADHLFTEVFSRQEADVQQVLLMTAVADPAPLDLVVRLSGRDDAGSTLDATGRRSGLVVAVSREDGTLAYHLHPILQGYLLGELRRRDAGGEQAAQAEAAAWFRERGESLQAVRHALRANDRDVLEETLASVGLRAVHDGLSEPLLEVLGSVPGRGGVGGWTGVVGAAALLDAGHLAEGAALLDQLPGQEGGTELGVAHAAVSALLRRRRGRVVPAMPDGGFLRSAGLPSDVELAYALHRGTELLRAGDTSAAETLLVRAEELAEGLGRESAQTDAAIALAGVSSARGDLYLLAERVARARGVAVRTGWIGSARAAYLHMLVGWGAHQRLEDGEARRHAQLAADLLDPQDDPTVVAAVHSLLLGSAEGAAEADTSWLHEVWQDAEDRRLAPDFVAYAAVADASVSLAAGRVDRLREVVEGLVDRLGECTETLLAGAHLRVARGQVGQALATLEPALQGEVGPVFPPSDVDAHAFAARVAIEGDNRFRAVTEMRHALDTAAALGCPRSLFGGGRPALELLVDGRGSWGAHEGLVDRVLGYVSLPPRRETVALTQRELDVLRELPTLRTVEEIATDMVVSVNTLKTHLRSVYRKLGVSSRRDAVTEARRSGLL